MQTFSVWVTCRENSGSDCDLAGSVSHMVMSEVFTAYGTLTPSLWLFGCVVSFSWISVSASEAA